MYLVPMDIYNQVKDKISTDDDIEMTSINQDLDRDDFFKETIKNEMKTNFKLPPLKKSPSNTNQTSAVTNQPQVSSTNQQSSLPSLNNSLNSTSTNTTTTTTTTGLTPASGVKRKMLTPKPTYKCETCDKEYKKRGNFLKHFCPNATRRNASLDNKSNSSLDDTYEEKEDKSTDLPVLRASSRNAHNKTYSNFFS